MSTDLAKRIRHLRRSLGKNQVEFGEMFDVTQGSVSRWESGSMPDPASVARLAKLCGQDVTSFLSGDLSSVVQESGERFMVKGEVAAGVWIDAFERPADEWEAYTGGRHVDVDASRRFGLRVNGDSMNEVYPHGTILDCVSAFDTDTPKSGQRVIVIRKRVTEGLEATVKEYQLDDTGREWLVPRSTNPAFQRPIAIDETEPDIEEIRIVALVVGSYRPE